MVLWSRHASSNFTLCAAGRGRALNPIDAFSRIERSFKSQNEDFTAKFQAAFKLSFHRMRYGRTRPHLNRYLRWVFAEAASSVATDYKRWPERRASQLYARLRLRKGQQSRRSGSAASG